MKICIIGNSHIAALKLAIRRRVYADAENTFTFWGTPGDSFNKIVYADRRFTTPETAMVMEVSDKQYTSLPIDHFDALVFHGNELCPSLIMESLRMFSSDLRNYSFQFLSEGLDRYLATFHAINLATMVARDFAGPVIVSPTPLLSETPGWLNHRTFDDDEYSYLCSLLTNLLRKRSILFAPQPKRTITQGKYTRAKYERGAVELIDLKNKGFRDYLHMNASYGKLVLKEVVDLAARENLNATSGSKVSTSALKALSARAAQTVRKLGSAIYAR
jgi:hypothetical protein